SYRHAIRLCELEGVTRAGSLQDARANDTTRTHQPDLWREKMHRPAASSGASRCTAKQLGEQFGGRQTFRQRVSVTPVRTENCVIRSQMGAHSRGDGLLAHIGVTRPMNKTACVAPSELLLGEAYE